MSTYTGNDTHCNLERFLSAQETAYPRALAEIRNGQKASHWMWYIFPQLRGLGQSNTAWYFGIEDMAEAKAYLAHPILGGRLREMSGELLKFSASDPKNFFGWIDAAKLRSCMTLFSLADEQEAVFRQVLDRFFDGARDPHTIRLLNTRRAGDAAP